MCDDVCSRLAPLFMVHSNQCDCCGRMFSRYDVHVVHIWTREVDLIMRTLSVHQCEPNLDVYGVWIEHLDPRIPRIALFARKDIAKDEELTFDYRMTGETPVVVQCVQRTTCH